MSSSQGTGGGAGPPATKLGVARPWELITSFTPTSQLFFCPVLANHPKEMNKLHPFRIFSPSLNYHKQMRRTLTNWLELRFGVLSGYVCVVPAGAAGIGHRAKDGHRCKDTQRRI